MARARTVAARVRTFPVSRSWAGARRPDRSGRPPPRHPRPLRRRLAHSAAAGARYRPHGLVPGGLALLGSGSSHAAAETTKGDHTYRVRRVYTPASRRSHHQGGRAPRARARERLDHGQLCLRRPRRRRRLSPVRIRLGHGRVGRRSVGERQRRRHRDRCRPTARALVAADLPGNAPLGAKRSSSTTARRCSTAPTTAGRGGSWATGRHRSRPSRRSGRTAASVRSTAARALYQLGSNAWPSMPVPRGDHVQALALSGAAIGWPLVSAAAAPVPARSGATSRASASRGVSPRRSRRSRRRRFRSRTPATHSRPQRTWRSGRLPTAAGRGASGSPAWGANRAPDGPRLQASRRSA